MIKHALWYLLIFKFMWPNLCKSDLPTLQQHVDIFIAHSVMPMAGLPTWKVKKILRFLYLYCSIAVCSKKTTGRCYAETKKKKKGLDLLNLKSVTFALQTEW